MPLQNRVTPFGDIVALDGRGTLMGNRGILHDDRRRIVRPWQGKRWIVCVLQFRGIRRTVMTPHTYTELFFLDEATAFAAGHRPCAECRRADYKRFCALWQSLFDTPARADDMDVVLHAQRLDGRRKRTYRDRLGRLPTGTLVALDDACWLVEGPVARRAHLGDIVLYRWSGMGYTARLTAAASLHVDVLTPKPLVEIITAGYRPAIHPTAEGTFENRT